MHESTLYPDPNRVFVVHWPESYLWDGQIYKFAKQTSKHTFWNIAICGLITVLKNSSVNKFERFQSKVDTLLKMQICIKHFYADV